MICFGGLRGWCVTCFGVWFVVGFWIEFVAVLDWV